MESVGKRVLLVGPYPPPYGGIASHIAYLVPALIEEGFEVFILSSDKVIKVTSEGSSTIIHLSKKNAISLLNPLTIYKNLSSFAMLKGFKLGFRRAIGGTLRANIIAKLVTQNKIQLISFYSMLNAYCVPILRKIFGVKIPFVLTIYGAIYENANFFYPRVKLVRSILDFSDKLLSSSRYCARSVELLGIDSSEIEPLYYGVDLLRFSPNVTGEKIRRTLHIGDEDKILLFVGRLNEEMGLDTVLGIIPDILSQRSDVVFLIVGARGPLEKDALNLQERYKNRVYVRVDVPSDDLPYYYAACDLVLAPTRDRHACMGMAIKEAMATGKPVIASHTGGIPEAVIDGETGVLLPTGSDLAVDKEAFCKALFELLDNTALLKQMGKNGRRRAEKLFRNERTCQRTLDIFNELINIKMSTYSVYKMRLGMKDKEQIKEESSRGRWDLFDGVLSPFKAETVRRYAGDSVLDVGCNTGQLVAYLASLGKRVAGVDIDANLINTAKQNYPDISFYVASANSLPFEDNSFDTCVCWNVLEHVKDDKMALRELWRIARKNVILCVPKKDNLLPYGQVTYRQYLDPTHRHYYSKEDIHKMFKELPGQKQINLEEITRISPIMAYVNIGYPAFPLRVIDELLFRLSPSRRKRRSFYSDILIIAEKEKSYYD